MKNISLWIKIQFFQENLSNFFYFINYNYFQNYFALIIGKIAGSINSFLEHILSKKGFLKIEYKNGI